MSLEELRKVLNEKKVIFGSERTLKMLKNGKLNAVYVASNCQTKIKEDIKYYAKLSNVNVIELEQANDELGVICKKPFSVSVISY